MDVPNAELRIPDAGEAGEPWGPSGEGRAARRQQAQQRLQSARARSHSAGRSTLEAALTRRVEVEGKSLERKMGRSSGAG